MSRSIFVLVFLLFCNLCSAQIVREYFFKDLEITDTLVVFCQEPQTDIAKQLHNRIYFDSTFLQKIKNEFYEEYEAEEKLMHFCGFDLFFYKLENGKLKLINKLNSTCGLHQFVCKENGLNMLLESGNPIKIDTIQKTPKTKQELIDILNQKSVLKWEYNKIFWEICKTSKYPHLYYDGRFRAKIVMDTAFSLPKNIDNFLMKYVANTNDINWNFPYQWGQTEGNNMKIKRFERLKEVVEIEVDFYLKKKDFKAFKSHKINSLKIKLDSDFPLLIYYKE